MFLLMKKVFFSIILNSVLFLFLIISIQNSQNKSKIDFLIAESVSLPISFIIGMSFISGSILGCLLPIEFRNPKKDLLKGN